MVIEETLEVGRPLDAVFDFVGDFANTREWDPGVADARRVTPGPIGVGTRYELQVRFGGRVLPMVYEVTRWEPPTRVVLRGSGATVTAIDDIRFEPTPSGTRIRYLADIRLKGLLRLFEPLLARRLRETGRAAIDGMQRALAA
jgi:carbon monoxide dehydrogenase subunit G